jgi:ribosomal protein S12 methylthiotransferase accessory factor YcaO
MHIERKSLLFNIPVSNFNIDQIYSSYAYIGNFKIGNKIGPSGTNAISNNKNISLKKCFSESLERRALMLGGKRDNGTNIVKTFDLISGEISQLPYEYTTYRIDKPYCIDTTGTAAHIDNRYATKKALLELIEKNSLFLFWYGRRGYLLEEIFYKKHTIYQRLIKEDLDVRIFINTDFYPIKVIIAVVIKDGLILSGGVGSSLHIYECINSALEEAYLLKWQNIYVDFIHQNHKYKRNLDMNYHRLCLDHLNSIQEYYSFSDLDKNININADEIEMKTILSGIPEWIKSIHVIYLDSNFKRIKIVKVFSKYLNNHIPIKSRIDLSIPINVNFLGLTEKDINNIPDCIIV